MTQQERKELQAAEEQWENEGGRVWPEPDEPSEPAAAPPSRTLVRIEGVVLTSAVAVAHLAPMTGAFGFQHFASHGCSAIALLFNMLAAFMLTTRVLFRDNVRLGQQLHQPGGSRMVMIEAIGAALVLAWLAPFYNLFHGMADASIAALGVTVSLLVSAAVNKSSRMAICHDLASAAVVVFAFIWVQALPHFRHSTHGEEFLGAVTIGSSSFHSLRTVIEMLAKWRGR